MWSAGAPIASSRRRPTREDREGPGSSGKPPLRTERPGPRRPRPPSILDQTDDIDTGKTRASLESEELHREPGPDHLGVQAFGEQPRRRGRSSRGEQVVDDQHFLPRRQSIDMDLQTIGSILQRILLTRGLPGKLARLARRHESGRQAHRDRRGEDVAARFDPEHLGDAPPLKPLRQPLQRHPEGLAILEERGDVLEDDSFFGEVRNIADEASQVHGSSVGPRRTPPRRAELAQGRIRKVSTPSSSSASAASNSSTRAPRGPCRSSPRNRSSRSGGPAATASTRPSGRFRTKPRSPSALATRSVGNRNPTP